MKRALPLLARLIAFLLVASVVVLVPRAPQAGAQGNPEWVCDGTPILMRGGNFHNIVPDPAVPGNLTIDTIPGTSGIWNSTGYDPTTNWVYGVGSISGEKTIRAYDAAGGIVFQTQIQDPYPDDAGTYAGTVLGDGRYIIHSVGKGGGVGWYAGARFNLWSINPATGAATHIGSTPVNFADFSYNPLDGYLYQVVNRVLYKVDPNNGSTSTTAMPGTFPNGSFGASWFDAAGFLYSFRNSPGDIFKVDPADTSTWVEVGEVGADGGTDGGSCVSQIDIKKDVVDASGASIMPDDRVYSAGDTITYKFTLINNGLPTQGLTADLCDVLPADGRTFTGNWTATTTASLTSGGLSGDTNMCIEVDMPSSLWTDPANPGAAPAEVTVDVVLGQDALAGTVENQATLDYDQDGDVDVISDDPGDGSDPRDPTTIEIRGSMDITKTVVGHPVDNGADQFTITLDCGAHTVQAGSIVSDLDDSAWPSAGTNTFTLTNGDRVRVADLPAGAVCTATESPSTAYATSTTSGDGTVTANSGTVTIDEPPNAELIEFTNRTGSFRLVKRNDLSGTPLPVDKDAEFSFDVVCDNGFADTVSFSTTNGTRTRSFPVMPLVADGASCTVTEIVPTGWNITSANDQVVTIVSGTEPKLDFTNERVYADLTVTKTIVGLPATADPTAYSFEVGIECSGEFDPNVYTVPGPLSIATDSPIVISDLPVGTACTVTETPAVGFNTRYSPDQTIVLEESGSLVAITNSTGSLVIEKNNVAPTTHPLDVVTNVDFTLDCTYPDTTTSSQSFTVAANSLTPTGATGGISHSDVGVLPPGTTCTATETSAPAGWSLTSPASIDLNITEANPEPTASFENTRDTGSLTITKSLLGVPAGLNLDDEIFTVDISCTGGFTVDPYLMSGLTLSAASPLVIDDLPTGANCSVTERPDPRFTPTVGTGSATIDSDGETVALTNTTSSFTVAKTTTSSAVVDDVDGVFDFSIVCQNGLTEVANTSITVSTTNGIGAAAVGDLPIVPPGSDCTITEMIPSGWTLTDRTGGVASGADGQTFTTTAAPLAIGFENTLDTAPLTITKDVTGAAATPALEAEVFTVAVTCTGNVDTGTWTSGPQNLIEGTPVVLSGLPVGAECSVAETPDDRFSTSYAPSNIVTIADSGNTVAITNETSSFTISKTTTVPATVEPDATFTFDISCTTEGTTVFTDTIAITTTAGNGTWGPPSAPFVEPGTICEITETPPIGWASVGSNTVSVTTTGASTVNAAFTNERTVADLTITKTLLGTTPVDFTNEAFTVDISCVGDFASSPLIVNNVVITSVAPGVVPDLPTGAVCTVSEDFDSRFQTLYSPDIGDGTAAQVTIDADGAEAGITNVSGTIAIRKDTLGPSEHGEDLLVDIDYLFDCDTLAPFTRTLSVADVSGGQGIGVITFTELPAMANGTICSVTETVPAGWTVTSANPQTVTAMTDPPVVQFTNERNAASLTITKVLDGVPPGVDLNDEPFTVDVSCTGGFTVNPYELLGETISVNNPLVITNLPTGADCTATEAADPRFTAATSGPVTIDADGEEITITNSTSTLSITKNTTGTTTHPVDLDASFSFGVDCGAAFDSVVLVTTTGQTGSWDTTTSPLVPPGTSCTVTEQGIPTGWELTSAADVVVTTSSAAIVAATFTNNRQTASLDITKTVTGAPVDLSDEEFLVDISCTGGFVTEPYSLGPLTLTENVPIALTDLPVGAACEVTEQADPRFTPGYDPDDQIGIIATGGTQVGIINRTATIKVTKEVVADADQPIDVSGSFDILVECSNGTSLTLDIDVVGGVTEVREYPALPLLPDGTACTLTELAPPAGWTLTTPNAVEVIANSENPGDVTFVNRRDTADLTVTKTVLGAPTGLDVGALTFTVDVSCTGDFVSSPLVFADQPISNGETITFSNLPTGSVCTVIEDLDPRFAATTTPAIAATTGITIDADGEDVAIVNATGEVMIVKNTEVTTTHPVDVTGSFTFAVDCGATYTGTHIVDAATVTSPTTATGFLRYDDLPALPDGTACSVSEQGPPAGWALSTTNPVPVTVDSAAVSTAAFTNTRDTGSLTITKALDGVPAGTDLDDETFTVAITCTGDFTGGTHTINGTITVNNPLVINELPTGATCSVTETPDPRFATTVSAPVTIDTNGEQLTVTNTTSTLSITKTTDGPTTHPLALDDTFTFTVDCGATYTGTPTITTTTQTGTWETPNTPLLPPGTNCTITETAASGWMTTSTNPQTVTTESTAVVDAAFTNTRDTGSLTITKALDGVPAGTDLDDETFTVAITCTGDFTGGTHTINGTITVNNPLVINELPTNSTCSVTETPDPRFATTVSAPVTIDTNGEQLTVTNTTSTLSITKTTDGPTTHPLALDDTFTFTVDCGATYTGTPTITTTTQTGTWETPNTPLLPPGTNCTITETAVPTGWNIEGAGSTTITTNAASIVDASFTNSRETSELTITKVLDGVPTGLDFDDALFGLTATCTGDFAGGTYEIAGDVSVNAALTITDLPTGASCEIVETADSRFAVAYSPSNVAGTAATVAVVPGGATAEITNTTGAIIISKETVVDQTHPIDPVATFNFTVDCGAAYNQVHALTTDLLTTTGAIGLLTYAELPVLGDGTSCDITELDETPDWELLTDRDISLVVSSTAPQTASFTNQRVVGSLVVEKMVAGPADLDLSGEMFDISISCSGGFTVDPYVMVATVSEATPHRVDVLPSGAKCTVEETADPRFATTYPDADATIVTDAEGGPAGLSILNQTGSFTIDKETFIDSSRPFDPDDEFTFVVSCTGANGSTYEETVTITTADGAGTWSSPLLPTGHECTIALVTPDGWAVLSADAVNFVIGTNVRVFAFQSERTLVSLTINKSLASIPGGLDFSDREFTISMQCDQGFQTADYTIPGAQLVSQDAAFVIDDLPAAATCTVTEAEDEFFTPTYSPSKAIVLSATGANQVTITNTGTQALIDWARASETPLAFTGIAAARFVWAGLLLLGAGLMILGFRRFAMTTDER